jgi:L-fuconolactonase
MTPRIDAHHHLWTLERPGQAFPTPDLAPIHRDFGMAELLPHLDRHAIDATILVQVCEDAAETAWMLRLAAAEARVAGVVGWLELEAPDAPAAIAAAAADPLLVGLRPMVQGMADDGWLARPALAPAFEAMAAHGLVLDGLARPRHLASLRRVAERHPALRIVLDHCGKPEVAAGRLDPWRAEVEALAGLPNTACKLSGLVTEAAPDWRLEDLRPVAAHVLRAFGPGRVMWGSDSPVVELAGGYAAWAEAAEALLGGLPASDRDEVMGGTAARIYLDTRGRRPC